MKDFEGMSYDEIRLIFKKVWDFNHNFVPMDLEIEKEKKKPAEFQEIEEEQIEKDTSKKTTGKRKKYLPRRRTRSTAKKQKVEQDDEKEELKNYLDIVPREDVAVDVESLSTKYPIVDWKTYTLLENFMYYKIIRGDGSSKNYKILKLHTLFEPDEDSEIWMNQNEYNLISWSLCDFCGVHILLMQNGIAIHMLTEKKYPLSQEMISKMLSKRLEVDQESTQAYELLNFIRSQAKNDENCGLLYASSSREETMEEKANLFQIYEPIFRELAREFFSSFEFDATLCRVGLYSERESRDVATPSGLRNAEMVNSTRLTHMLWPTISDGGYNVGNTKAKSIRNPRIKLAHRCITMTITGKKETTNRVTKIDLFYLYCIFMEGVVCNIPYWLAKYLKCIREKSVIFRGMFVTRIAQSFGLLTNEMVSVLNREPPLYVYRKTSLVKMGVIKELHEGECCWPATKEVAEEGGGDDGEGDREGGNEGIRGSTDIYRNISQGDWQARQACLMD
ncbi:retrotransposon ORF1 [Tanacetum coccineum]